MTPDAASTSMVRLKSSALTIAVLVPVLALALVIAWLTVAVRRLSRRARA